MNEESCTPLHPSSPADRTPTIRLSPAPTPGYTSHHEHDGFSNASLDWLRREISKLGQRTQDNQKFIPEEPLRRLFSEKIVREVVHTFNRPNLVDEIVTFVIGGAAIIFGILVDIGYADHIISFARNNNYKQKCDERLPISRKELQTILNDEHVAENFFDTQWKFSVPKLDCRIIPRHLEELTILPYRANKLLDEGVHGLIYKVEFHPDYSPPGLLPGQKLVRKEFKYNNSTYDNEILVLSTLQRLKHPNILPLITCYTYKSIGNLISPLISGGSVKDLIKSSTWDARPKHELYASIAGLTSALWALHQYPPESMGIALKGQHADLHHGNVLVDGNQFILADFGLSKIKPADAPSLTSNNGDRGYCEAPEAAELASPFGEFPASRARDVFSLGCIITDLLIYAEFGSSGVKQFEARRGFEINRIRLYLFHKGDSANEAVNEWLQKIVDKAAGSVQSVAVSDARRLVLWMLELSPISRPSIDKATAEWCMVAIAAFVSQILRSFDSIPSSEPLRVAKIGVQSWEQSQSVSYYLSLGGATNVIVSFNRTMKLLHQIEDKLQEIKTRMLPDHDDRMFRQVRVLTFDLLNALPKDRRADSDRWLRSCSLSTLKVDSTNAANSSVTAAIGTLTSTGNDRTVATEQRNSSLIGSKLDEMVQIKCKVANMKMDKPQIAATPIFRIIEEATASIEHEQGTLGEYQIAKVKMKREQTEARQVIVEKIRYHDHLERQRLLPRVHALCEVLSDVNTSRSLSVLPFYALFENTEKLSFNLLYDFPRVGGNIMAVASHMGPKLLSGLLGHRFQGRNPSLESRINLSSALVESLATLHEVGWYHKDLRSPNILFFSTDQNDTSTTIRQPYLIGFEHSRQVSDERSIGPPRDAAVQRYQHPQYIGGSEYEYQKFSPRFDHYSLGILLLEIGMWQSLDTIMREHLGESSEVFSKILIEKKTLDLPFFTGEDYSMIVKKCLVGLDQSRDGIQDDSVTQESISLSFTEQVVIPLGALAHKYNKDQGSRKRRRSED